MPIVPVGSTNLAAIGVPNAIIQIVPPNPLLNGVPTNIIGVVGIASWGPVNSPVVIGSMQQQVSMFGNPLNLTYDMGTQVFTSFLQGASSFICVRVTDGTDTPSQVNVLDSTLTTALVLSALYTGTVGNTLGASITAGSNSTASAPTYKLNVWAAGGIPETFDNIGGSGSSFWTNLANAINIGQGPQRGPSNLVRAGIPGAVASVAVGVAGVYGTLPTVTATIGSGATFTVSMKAVSAVIAPTHGGTTYVVGDTITLAGGTGTEPILTVTSVSAGAVTGVSITNAGSLTALPANPVSQGSTSGTGSGAEFNLQWGLASISGSGGTGYTSNSQIVITGGAPVSNGTATVTVTPSASTNPPSIISNNYSFSGGTNGNTTITDATVIGSDTNTPRSGMYALRNTNASVGIIADQTDPTLWSSQVTFGSQESIYMIGVMANAYSNNIAAAVALRQANNIANYEFKLMLGDWCQIFDPFNNVYRFVSPAGFVAGILGTQLPSNSSLNKIMNGIVVTQKTSQAQTYSNADLQQLQSGGIDVITKPIPASDSAYGVRLGINTSGNVATIGDNYTRMINFLGETFEQGLGQFIGLPQTPEVQGQARATLQSFLQNIQDLGMIGTLNGNPAYQVILDSSNNLPVQVSLGYMQANVQVTLWSIIFQFIVNLQAGQSVNIQVLPPQLI